MLYFTENKSLCTGCTACLSVCPQKCIKMERDIEGFLYPVASDRCIRCGRCEKVCPRLNKFEGYSCDKQVAYAAVSKDKQIWKRSASGGAFSEICRAFGDSDTLVCGAKWNGLRVEHECIVGVENIEPLCKSKYVASNLGNCFSQIKSKLENGGKVIFCGTPCQVAGLRAYLGKEYDKLLLIDLICHGVGSPFVFEECIRLTGIQLGITPIKYCFRYKPGNTFITRHISLISDGEKEYLITEDQYNQLFLSQKCLRPSCGENCIYRNEARQADFTIADFNGADFPFKDLTLEKENYSSIVVNSDKAIKLMNEIQTLMKVYFVDIKNIKKYNPLFFRQTWYSYDRDAFFEDFEKGNLRQWVKPATNYKISLKRKIYNHMPIAVKRLVRMVLKHETK